MLWTPHPSVLVVGGEEALIEEPLVGARGAKRLQNDDALLESMHVVLAVRQRVHNLLVFADKGARVHQLVVQRVEDALEVGESATRASEKRALNGVFAELAILRIDLTEEHAVAGEASHALHEPRVRPVHDATRTPRARVRIDEVVRTVRVP